MKTVNLVAFLLVVIGGINWGLMGLMNLDLVAKIFGDMSTITKAIYVLVGASAVYMLVTMLPKQMSK